MQIGTDFPKIQFELFNLQLSEPNGFIGNLLITFTAFFIAVQIRKYITNNSFYKNWILFYIIFGFTFLSGGFSHLLFNYFGIYGKYISWYLGILAPYFVERAFIEIHPNIKKRTSLKKFPISKLILFIILETIIIIYYGKEITSEKGVLVSSLASVIGLGICLGIFAPFYQKKINKNFKYFWIATIIQIISGVVQIIKLNIHPYFDRNDLSHLLLVVSLLLYYKAIKNIYKNDLFITNV